MLDSTKVIITRHALEMWRARIDGSDTAEIESYVRRSTPASKNLYQKYRRFQASRPARIRHGNVSRDFSRGNKILMISRGAKALFVTAPSRGVLTVVTVYPLGIFLSVKSEKLSSREKK